MTRAGSGRTSRGPLASYDPATSSWRTFADTLDGDSELFSGPLPTWGMTRRGVLSALPKPELRTAANECSSLLPSPRANKWGPADSHGKVPAVLLPTPTTTQRGPDTYQETRPAAGPNLHNAIALLPTPKATDGTKGGPNQRGSSGDLMLPSAVLLLPTPAAHDSGNDPQTHLRKKPGRSQVTSLQIIVDHGLLSSGGHMAPPLNDGESPQGAQLHDQLSLDATANG